MPANPSIDLLKELKAFRIKPCCKVLDAKGKLKEKFFNKNGKIYCKVCKRHVADVAKREEAFHQIFKYFLPKIYELLKKLTFTNKLEAVQFIRLQLFRIVDNKNLRMDNGKQLTMYITGILDKRVQNDNFKGPDDGSAEGHCIKGLYRAQYRFRNAKKRYIQKHKRVPELENDSDLKEFCKIFNGDKQDVKTIAANLSNPIDSFEKKIPFDKNGNSFRLVDVIPSENDSPEDECITSKTSEIILERLNTLLTPEQAELVKLYYLADEELTKEQIAERLKWKRFSKAQGKEVLDVSKVKNNLTISIEKLKKDHVLEQLL